MNNSDGDLQGLLEAHTDLDFACRNRNGRVFPGDWHTENPFVDNIIGEQCIDDFRKQHLDAYYFYGDATDVQDSIGLFHEKHDQVTYSEDEIFVGAGMTPLITAQMFMLKARGVTRLYYIAPVYTTYYYLAQMVGIELVPLVASPLYQGEVELPTGENEWLLICDPIWFMGRSLQSSVIDAVKKWQTEHNGFVLVDGAFQYTRWRNGPRTELTAQLDRQRTVRTICPTKGVALHGVRFSYCLTSSEIRNELRRAYANAAGSGSAFDQAAAVSIMGYLNGPSSSSEILNRIASRYEMLTTQGLIEDAIGAETAYFCFVKTKIDNSDMISMGQEFFNITGFPGLTRLNLLMPENELDHFIALSNR